MKGDQGQFVRLITLMTDVEPNGQHPDLKEGAVY